MKGLLYHGAHHRPTWADLPDPAIRDDRDAIVQVDTVTLCGTDLHILRGDVPEVAAGRVLGHEAVGTVVAAGRSVELTAGDRVLVSCISGCGRCRFCRQGAYGQCLSGGGWVLGHTIDGVQAELVRVPYADLACHRLPEQISDEAAVLCADILTTAYEVGIRNDRVGPGDVVAIVGAGPIGLAAILTARLYSPGTIVVIDPVVRRLDLAKQLGADVTLDGQADPREAVAELTDGLGADVVIEAVGTPEAFGTCCTLVRPGGHLANIGVHGAPAMLPLQDLWARNVTITTGLVDTDTTPLLLRLLAAGQLDPTPIITHRLALAEPPGPPSRAGRTPPRSAQQKRHQPFREPGSAILDTGSRIPVRVRLSPHPSPVPTNATTHRMSSRTRSTRPCQRNTPSRSIRKPLQNSHAMPAVASAATTSPATAAKPPTTTASAATRWAVNCGGSSAAAQHPATTAMKPAASNTSVTRPVARAAVNRPSDGRCTAHLPRRRPHPACGPHSRQHRRRVPNPSADGFPTWAAAVLTQFLRRRR